MAESGLALLSFTLILRNGKTNRTCQIQNQMQHWKEHIEGDKGMGQEKTLPILAHGLRKEMCGLNRKTSRLGRVEQGMTHVPDGSVDRSSTWGCGTG